MRLPSLDKIFPVNLEVVTVPKDFCRCHFADIHPAAENLLHIYILELQKEKIREILLPWDFYILSGILIKIENLLLIQ